MIFGVFAILTAATVAVVADPSPLDTGFCQIVVHYSQWCIGINSRNQARNMPCSSKDTRFHRFPDGSLRLLGREDDCLKKGSSLDMVYGPCRGAYTFNPKYMSGYPSPKTYKIYSTHPSYKNYFFDIGGTSPKEDASAILYSSGESYIESDHYYDLKNCVKLGSALASISQRWIPFTEANNTNNKVTFSGTQFNAHSVRMPCNGGWFKLYYNTGHFEIFASNKGNLFCKNAGRRNWYSGEKYDFSFVKQHCIKGFVQFNVVKTPKDFVVYVNGTQIFRKVFGSASGECLKDIDRVTTYVYDKRPMTFYLGIDPPIKGQYIDGTGRYTDCPQNFWCENFSTKKSCPKGGKSPAKSTSVNACVRTCTCKQTLRGNAEPNCNITKSCSCA